MMELWKTKLKISKELVLWKKKVNLLNVWMFTYEYKYKKIDVCEVYESHLISQINVFFIQIKVYDKDMAFARWRERERGHSNM